MNILDNIYLKLSKYEVIHSIPGRMRLKINELKNVPAIWKNSDGIIIQLFKKINGIKNIEINYVTSNAVIFYDTQATGHDEIIEKINEMRKVLIKNREFLEGYSIGRSNDDILAEVEKLLFK